MADCAELGWLQPVLVPVRFNLLAGNLGVFQCSAMRTYAGVRVFFGHDRLEVNIVHTAPSRATTVHRSVLNATVSMSPTGLRIHGFRKALAVVHWQYATRIFDGEPRYYVVLDPW